MDSGLEADGSCIGGNGPVIAHPTNSTAVIVISMCFISLQLSILHPSCRRVYG